MSLLNTNNYILESICVWNVDHASQIFECLKIVFEDLQEEEEEEEEG